MHSIPVAYRTKSADEEAIRLHLGRCADAFDPPLSDRIDISAYSRKLFERSVTFEAWAGPLLVGLVAVYLNDADRRSAFVTSVSVDREFRRQGIARELIARCVARARELGFAAIQLEVSPRDRRALPLYAHAGFVEYDRRADAVLMVLRLEPE